MNISYYQNQVNKIEKEIADLHKKIADESKKEITKNKQIDSIQRTINKNTPISSIQSKQRQIQSLNKDLLNCMQKKSEFQSKIASKNVELGKRKNELRNAEKKEVDRSAQAQLDFQRKLNREIDAQKKQLDTLIEMNYSSKIGDSEVEPSNQKEYDFFISHAYEDKNEIVKALANALVKAGFEVWYDEFELTLGDSIRKKIDLGLSKSRYGIVIISPSFIKKKWTDYELNGMFAKEMNGHKVVLPVWHKITKDEVLEYSPSLSDKMAMNTSIHSIKDIVEQLKKL